MSLSDSSQVEQELPASLVMRAQIISPLTIKGYSVKHIIGDSLSLLSALFYALYVTLLKVRIRNESRIDMQLFFGFVGLFNILVTWPIGVVLHLTGVEPFELPSKTSSIIAVLISVRNGMISFWRINTDPYDRWQSPYPVISFMSSLC